jgi:hypothetical protein
MFARLARMLGVSVPQLEDALRSEKRARAQLSRRGLLLAGAAGVATAILPERAWSFPTQAGVCRSLSFAQLSARVHQPFWDILVQYSGWTAGVLTQHDEPLFPGL